MAARAKASQPRAAGAGPLGAEAVHAVDDEQHALAAAHRGCAGTGSFTPVLECTQVSATSRVRGRDGPPQPVHDLVHRGPRGIVVQPHAPHRQAAETQRLVRGVEVVLARQHLRRRRAAAGRRTAARGPSSSSP